MARIDFIPPSDFNMCEFLEYVDTLPYPYGEIYFNTRSYHWSRILSEPDYLAHVNQYELERLFNKYMYEIRMARSHQKDKK